MLIDIVSYPSLLMYHFAECYLALTVYDEIFLGSICRDVCETDSWKSWQTTQNVVGETYIFSIIVQLATKEFKEIHFLGQFVVSSIYNDLRCEIKTNEKKV